MKYAPLFIVALAAASAVVISSHFGLRPSEKIAVPAVASAYPDEAAALGECTCALISGRLTPNGRPILWKNRDVSFPNQEFAHIEGGNYEYTTIITAGDTTNAWGGVNSAGFAIINSTALNFPDSNAATDDDGWHIREGLRNCTRVEDFEAIVASTDEAGRTCPANYMMIDAFGGGMIYEAAAHSHRSYSINDSVDAPEGFMVRTNFAYSGPDAGRVGQWRHDKAVDSIRAAIRDDRLNAAFILGTVARNVAPPNFEPYPLPYDSIYPGRGWPTGFIPASSSINRISSVSCALIEGVEPGEDPLLSTVFAMIGQPILTLPVPLWVRSNAIPRSMNGDSTSEMCDLTLRLKARIFNTSLAPEALNTRKLVNADHTGLLELTDPVLADIISVAEARVATWRQGFPEAADMAAFQDSLASVVMTTLGSWQDKTIIRVPEDYATPQEAIQASLPGDTVLLAPGRYFGPIDFLGRQVVVGSYYLTTGNPAYIDSTILDGNRNGRSLTLFQNGETRRTELAGVTMTNDSTNYGGAIYCRTASPTIRLCIIKGNRASNSGSAVYPTRGSFPRLDHVVMYGNIAGNTGYTIGLRDSSHVELTNSIVWGNFPNSLPPNLNITYCDIEPDYEGVGIIQADPEFADARTGNFRLTGNSPCLDRANPEEALEPDGTRSDLGVFPFHQKDIAFSTTGVRFRQIWWGEVDSLPVEIRNTGGTELTINAISPALDMSCIWVDVPETPLQIAPDSTFTLWFFVRPDSGAGLISTTVWVESNDPDEARVEITAQGEWPNGVAPNGATPVSFGISRIYPNPFNSTTRIEYGLTRQGVASMALYDVAGRLVKSLTGGNQSVGMHSLSLTGEGLTSGLYFIKLNSGPRQDIRRVVLVR